MTLRQLIGECFALFCAVMLGLAIGAVWLLPTLYFHRPMPWLAVPAGWLLANLICMWVDRRVWHAATLSAVATAVAAVYAHVLTVATRLWELTAGYGLIGVIRTAGLRMLLDLASIGVGALDIVWALVGIIVAVLVSLRMLRKTQRTAT